MNIKNIIKNIWNDNVIGSVLSSIIYTFLGSFLCLITSRIPFLRSFFLNKISVYLFIILILLSFIIILFIVLIKRIKRILAFKDKKISNLLIEIQKLNNELCELKKESENPRMKLFSEGDVVIIKGSDACFSVVEYTVVKKTKDYIVIVDNKGNSKTISPNALLTTKEYQEESRKQKIEYDRLLDRNGNKRGYDPFSYLY